MKCRSSCRESFAGMIKENNKNYLKKKKFCSTRIKALTLFFCQDIALFRGNPKIKSIF
jgi:restriction endonuclease